jgi:hypothetical protein
MHKVFYGEYYIEVALSKVVLSEKSRIEKIIKKNLAISKVNLFDSSVIFQK